MRADRLVAALLVLQARGQVTAAELADELEVSERTARRDLEALAIAGVPVYSRSGRGGGWALVGGARTDLTGLTAPEARALLLTVESAPTASPALRRALRKLVGAMPEAFQADAEASADSVLVDPARWGRPATSEEVPELEALQLAVVRNERVTMTYERPGGERSTRMVDPLGLVNKAATWYLVADTAAGRRTFRVGRVRSVRPTGERFTRPEEFDLELEWARSRDAFEQAQRIVVATGNTEEWTLGPLRLLFGVHLEVGARRPDGRYGFVAGGPSVDMVAALLAGFAPSVQVAGPDEVTGRLAAIGAALVEDYGSQVRR